MKNPFLICMITAFLFSCNDLKKDQSIVKLEYLGYSDTIVAILYGRIVDDKNQPIHGVRIHSDDSVHHVQTDSIGNFELGFESGKYDVLVQKEGFQPILLKGYTANSDQVTKVDIQLSSKRRDTLEYDASPKK